MHIPDGFLSLLVALICWACSAGMIAIALRRMKRVAGDQAAPLMGMLAAAIFAGQMLNFTVIGGTSGHLLGAALATILVGPWAAVLVMTSVVSVQALIFQDGGLLALGANLLNMAVIGVLVAEGVYQAVRRLAGKRAWGLFGSAFSAAWGSVFVASLAVALQLALSGASPANLAVPAMAAIHALIGIGEGLITVGAVAFLRAARPQLLDLETRQHVGARFSLAGLAVVLLLAIASPLASAHPDGLEWVAEQQGFLGLAQQPMYTLIPDYVVPGLNNPALATIAAGLLGVGIVLGTVWWAGRGLRRGGRVDE